MVPLLSKEQPLDFRLPNDLVPEYYNLQIQPRLVENNFTFRGNVTISVLCVSSTRKITLHAKDLEILDTKVFESESNLGVRKVKKDSENDFLILYMKVDLKQNKRYQIKISFSGYLSDVSQGFYWKNYTYKGQTKYMAATNFKPTYARRAFPCFDEPDLKATFGITIIRSEKEMSLSNMPKKSTENREDGWKADVYKDTIKISTYLVAFMVGDFHNNENKRTENRTMSLWTKSRSVDREIKEVVRESNEIFDSYLKNLDFHLTLEKVDILVIPNDSEEPISEFGTDGALGCWGLIMIDEHNMNFDSKVDLDTRQVSTSRIAHAITHHLFGNIVTPKWWNDAWLSESIATYMEMVEVDVLHSDWKWLNKSIIRSNKYVEEDCSKDSHIVSMTVDKPSKIMDQLNNFAVSIKGARILRMISHIMGEKNFLDGLSKFLKDKAFKSVDQDEFWSYLIEAQSDINKTLKLELKGLINWIHNPGHPLVTATIQTSSNMIHLNQVSCRKDSSTLWKIPVIYIDEHKETKEKSITWLSTSNKSIEPSKNVDWVLINPEQMGFYQVNYDKENWKRLAKKLAEDHKEIPAVNRFQLLFDSLYFARKNLSSYENFFNVLTYLHNEQDDNVIEFLAIANLSDIGKVVRRRVSKEWKEYIGIITKTLYERKFKDEKFDTKTESETKLLLKKEIFTGVCAINEPFCIDMAAEKYKNWIEKKKKITRNERPLMKLFLCIAVKDDTSRWEDAFDYFKNLTGKFPAGEIIYALGCRTNELQLFEAVKNVIFDDVNYLTNIFESILDNSNWEVIFKILGSLWNRLQQNFNEVIKTLTEVIANREELAKVNEFYKTHKDKMTKSQMNSFEKCVKKAEKRISLMDYQLPDIINWLQKRNWKEV